MARKKKTRYVCQECGYDSLQWLGKCPGCGSWNTMVEEIVPEVDVETGRVLLTPPPGLIDGDEADVSTESPES